MHFILECLKLHSNVTRHTLEQEDDLVSQQNQRVYPDDPQMMSHKKRRALNRRLGVNQVGTVSLKMYG